MQVGQSNATTNTAAPRPKAPAASAKPPVIAKDATVAKAIWAGAAGNRKVSWTTADIRATLPDGKLFSLKDDLAKQMGVDAMPAGTTASAKAHVKSLVGNVLSVQWSHDSYVPGDAHPDSGMAFKAVDLANGGKPIALTELFPAGAIHKALLADPLVKQALGKQQPADLPALLKALEYKTIKVRGHEYMFDPAMLERFAIHHVEGTNAFVRVGLEASSGADRDAFAQLGLKLEIPEGLRDGFQQAEKAGNVGRALEKVKQPMVAKYR